MGPLVNDSVNGLFHIQKEKVITSFNSTLKITHPNNKNNVPVSRCIASCVAVVAAISLMLQRQDKHVLPSGAYNVEQITDDSYALAKTHLAGKHLVRKHQAFLSCHCTVM